MVTASPQTDSEKSLKKPKLSLILCARSDQYQGNSRWRLEVALNYLGQNVAQLGREEDVEVIVTDWGSETPLRDLMKLTPEAARIVSYMLVQPDIAKAEQKDSKFPEVLALNAAARRAKGDYIGRIDQDTLVGKHFLETFFWLEEKPRLIVPLESALLLSNRRRIPYRFAVFCPPLAVVDRYVRWIKRFMPLMFPLPPHLFYQSFVGIWLLHRDIWYECGGYNEEFIYMDWQEVEMMLRLTPKYTLVNLGELTDHDLYHLDHAHPLGTWEAARNRKANPEQSVERRPHNLYPNTEQWGLNQYDFELLPTAAPTAPKPQSHWLTFILLLVISSIQIGGDLLIMAGRTIGNKLIQGLFRIWWFVFAPSTWKNRAQNAQEIVSGQPLLSWPKLLMTRRSQKQARRT